MQGISEWPVNETRPMQVMLGISEWPGNESRPKLCREYWSGLGMRLCWEYQGMSIGQSYAGNIRMACE